MGWAADFAQALGSQPVPAYRQLIQPVSSSGQPHYDGADRWQRNGVVEGPAKLLPRSKRYGQAPILDRWMLEAVVSYLAARSPAPLRFISSTVGQDGGRRNLSSAPSAICSTTMAWPANAWASRSRKPRRW